MAENSPIPQGVPDIGDVQQQADPVALAIAQMPAQIDNLASQLKQALVQGYLNGWNQMWRNPTGLTPKQAFAALGTKATAFLYRGGALKAFVIQQYPDLASGLPGIPSNFDLAYNEDGSVTVTEK